MQRFPTVMAGLALACAASPALAQAAEERSAVRMQQRSAAIARSYLQAWSSSTRAALNQVSQLYAPRTRFFGQPVGHQELLREKAAFVRRWPVRRYAHRPGTMKVACDLQSARCIVRSVIDWRAESPNRHAASRGSWRFEQGIDFSGPRPVVFFENGSALSHGLVHEPGVGQPRAPERAKADAPLRPIMARVVAASVASRADPALLTPLPAAKASASTIPEPSRSWTDPPAPEPSVTGANAASGQGGPATARAAVQAAGGFQAPVPTGVPEQDERPSVETAPRLAFATAKDGPPALGAPEPEGLVLYLATQDDVRALADLNGKPIALGAQEPAVEMAIRQAFAAARVTPTFVGDADTDALERLSAHEIAAAPFLIASRDAELARATRTLSQLGYRLLAVPLDGQPPR